MHENWQHFKIGLVIVLALYALVMWYGVSHGNWSF